MSVRVDNSVVHLEGRCGAEDAEALLLALQESPGRIVDVSGLLRLHLAVAQILIAARPEIRGAPESVFLARHLPDLLQ